MRRIVGYDYLLGLFLIFIFFAYSLCSIFTCDSEYYITCILPIVYIIGYLVWGFFSYNTAVLIKKIVMLLMAVKMVLIPGLIILNQGFEASRFNEQIFSYIPDAVFLQIVEFVIVLVCVTFTKWSNFSLDYSPFSVDGSDFEKVASKNVWRVLGFCILIILVTIIVFPAFLNRLRPIFFLNETTEIYWKKNADLALNSLPSIIYYPINWLFIASRLALAYMMVVKIYKSKIRMTDGMKLFVSLITTIVILVLIVPDSVATSVYAALTIFLLLYILYPQKRKSIMIVVITVCIAVLLGAFVIMPITSGRGVSVNYIATKLNAYFSGYVNTAAAVAMDNYPSSRLDMLAGDFFRSLPILRGLFTSMPMSNELFNVALGYDTVYNSQIIPLEGQGYYYLSYFGTIVFTMFHMYILKKFYRKVAYSQSSFTFYVYGILTLIMVFGLVMYGAFLCFSLVLEQIPLLLINALFVRRVQDESINLS